VLTPHKSAAAASSRRPLVGTTADASRPYNGGMTVSSPPPPKTTRTQFNPDDYRMTVGEHLDELRWRLILSLIGFVIITIGCFLFAPRVVSAFCAPLMNTLLKYDLNTQLITDNVPEGFMTVIKITLITGAAFSAPWVLYHLWQFIAAGLYPHERKYVTRYLPLSISLLIGGMLFVYFLVLPWTLDFFIGYSISMPLRLPQHDAAPALPPDKLGPQFIFPLVAGDPATPAEGQVWINTEQQRVKMFFNGRERVMAFSAEQLLATEFKLSYYIDLVVSMLLVFGISFQLPLVVLALTRIGIVQIDQLRTFRRYVYFGLVVVSSAVTPGDVITATIALLVPLCLLYELGIWLAAMGQRRRQAEDDAVE
jgi:sec-independent protein translocase protein TatC